MATFDYQECRDDVEEVLVELGIPVELDRGNSAATYNPVTGKFEGGVVVLLNGLGVLVGYKNREIDGTEIRATDRKLLFQGDELLIGDLYKKWRVHAINNIDPDESGTILTIAQMRK